MATAARNASPTAPAGAVRPEPTPDEPRFAVFSDNGGRYHWEILAADGESLARSGGFSSEKEASKAARSVCTGAGPVDLSGAASDATRTARR